LSQQYPDTFDRYYRPVWNKHRRIEEAGGRVFFQGLPQLCQVCQVPMAFSEVSDPTRISLRRSEFRG